jgi:GntR family transcriptional regulator, transcriptional repressor for pyruvate dehydrogenase complex
MSRPARQRLHIVRPRSLSESVYRALEEKILSHELAPGQTLPSERELSDELGVNRGAVREAIKRLQQAGLVAVRHGGNHTVLDYRDEGGLELLPSLLVDSKGQINPAVARAILTLRSSLAPEVAAAAAKHGSVKTAAALDVIVRRMRESQNDTSALQELAMDYWRTIVDSSGNIAYRLSFNSLNKSYRRVWGLLTALMQDEFRDTDNLQNLADAIRKRDGETARDCAARHVALGRNALEHNLESLLTSRKRA